MKKLLLALFLTSCAQKFDILPQNRIYQPSYLFLEAGKPIQTKEGTYVPQTDETWFSAEKIEKLEKQLSEFK